MKWTPKRVVALCAAGLIAWGASTSIDAPAGELSATHPPDTQGNGPSASPTDTQSDSSSASAAPANGTAAAVLATLPVKGRAPMTGYTREQFGQAWSDDVTVAFGHNGCDTRNDILRRDLRDSTLKAGTNGCVVLTGSFVEPYSGKAVAFTRGPDTSSLIQIDHVVALADAWRSGAQQWSADTRRNYANDPLLLLAADGTLNQQKGAANAASWLPPNKSFRCSYVARQVATKAKYHLWVTPAERDAIARVLSSCPGQPLPTDTSASPVAEPTADLQPGTQATPALTRQPAIVSPVAPTTEPAGDVSYENCPAARAAGAAPIDFGEPGYSRKLDRDGDGVACE